MLMQDGDGLPDEFFEVVTEVRAPVADGVAAVGGVGNPGSDGASPGVPELRVTLHAQDQGRAGDPRRCGDGTVAQKRNTNDAGMKFIRL